MEHKTYSVGWETSLFNADALKVSDEIASLGESASTDEILDKARDESTELHKCFDWDDSIAAEKWRKHQVVYIISNLVYTEVNDEGKQEPTSIKVFYKPDTSYSTGYKKTSLIVQNVDEYESLLRKCERELKAIRKKYDNLSEYNKVWELIDAL